MKTVKDFFEFTNAAIFSDYKSIAIICELNPVRTFYN